MRNKINDILKLLTIISNSEDGVSIRELHHKTGISIEIIKDNLENIWYNTELYLVDLAPEDDVAYEKTRASSDSLDLKWTIDNFCKDDVVLNLNHFERYLFKSILTKSENTDTSLLGIKTKSTYGIEDYKYKLCQISMAIDNKKSIISKYKTKAGKIEDFIIEPLCIVFYEFENLLYIIGQYNNSIVTYRLDKILHIKETENNFLPIEGFNIEEYLSNIWGMEQGEPIKVKIKFLREANVFHRVKRDLSCRTNKNLTEYVDHIIYEDTVVGIHRFKSWLRSFGSSAIVLEPKVLKEDMLTSAKHSLEYYT